MPLLLKNGRSHMCVPMQISGLWRHLFSLGLRWLYLSLAVTANAVVADEAPWILKKKSDGIAVYSRDVANSAIDEIRAVADIIGPPDLVLAYLLNVTNRPRWNTLTAVAEALPNNGKPGESSRVYLRYDMPWPVEDRDMVMTMTSHVGRHGFVAEAVTSTYRRGDGAVRVTIASEQWDIQPSDQGSTITMTVFMDPAGPIPAWLINSMSVSQPIEVMQRLRQQLSVLDKNP